MRWTLVLWFLAVFLLGLSLLGALSLSGPSITPLDDRNPTTEDILTCSWVTSGDTTSQNVTWYNGSVLYTGPKNVPLIENSSILPAHIAKKGESWTCNVSVANATSWSWSTTTVTIKNALPSLPNASDQTLYEDVTAFIDITTTDPDGDSLSYYKLGNDPSYCTVAESTGIVTCMPDELDVGLVNATFFTDDGGAYFAKANVSYTVLEVNDPPTFTITDQNATEDIAMNLTLTVTDEENDWPINFTLGSNLSSLRIAANSQNTGYITFNRPSYAPLFSEKGRWFVQVNATDSGPSTNTPYDNPVYSATFWLTVQTVNQAPVFLTNFSNETGTQGSRLTFVVNATDADANELMSFDITSPCANSPWNITTTDNSSNASGLVNVTLTNNHIICREINISVFDGEEYDWFSATLNLTNTNDAPEILEMSYAPSNSGQNMSNLSTIKGLQFTYTVNVSDPDQYTYEGENLSFSDNTSMFTIGSDGLIQFTPGAGDIGLKQVLINVSDDEGLFATRVLSLEVKNNTPPTLNSVGNFSCAEDFPCVKDIIANDPDTGEDLVFTSNVSSLFNLTDVNTTAARVNFVPVNGQVGSYRVNFSVQDQYGFSDWELVTLMINNTNDAPFFDQDGDGGPDAINPNLIVEGYDAVIRVNVTDEDLDLGLDNLTINYSFTRDVGHLSSIVSVLGQGVDYLIIGFMPNSSQVGVQGINFSVVDTNGSMDWQNVSFEIFSRTQKPTFVSVRPFKFGSNDTSTSFGSASLFPTNQTSVNFTENVSVVFDVIATNDSGIENNSMTYYWYVDGSLVSTLGSVNPGANSSYTLPISFFDSGSKSVLLRSIDRRYARAEWSWTVNVSNVNRAPEIVGDLTNITTNTSLLVEDYFSYRSGYQRFYDPDEDLDEDGFRGEIYGEETNLTYDFSSATNCSIAAFTFTGDNIQIVPEEIGTCIVQFEATDPEGLSVTSNTVWIIITDVVTDEVEVETSSGGGSSTRPRIVPLPIEEPVESPYPLDIIVPQEVTTFVNQTVEIPVVLENSWNESLLGISLNATSSNQSDTHDFRWGQDYFEQISTGENVSTILYVDNYRADSPFAVTITAVVESPDFQDSAIVFINAMERVETGDDVESKVTFARDLLNENPECQELTELLDKAEQERLSGNSAQALKLINVVVNGCKYLVNNQKTPENEQPKSFYTFSEYMNRNLAATIILGLVIVVMTAFGIAMIVTGRRRKDEDI